MPDFGSLRRVSLFADLPESDLARLCAACHEGEVAAGTTLFAEGDHGDAAYVITGGTIEIVKSAGAGEVLLAVRHEGEVIGEMALLQDEPRMASARARDDTTLLVIPRPALADLLESSPGAVRSLFDILLERLRSTEAQLRQTQRMAQLGTLTAGVAHELNNPASAVERAAHQLDAAVHAYAQAHAEAITELDADHRSALSTLTQQHMSPESPTIGALARADLEQELEDMLADAGVDEPWNVAADLVDAGFDADDLEALRAQFDGTTLATALKALCAGRTVESLVHTITSGAERLASIVTALKSYSFLDQAPQQELDVTTGIDDTIMILGAKLADIEITKHYAPDVPRIDAYGSELNQVWTNLLDNAADAIAERRAADGADAAGHITIDVAHDDQSIVVSITDDGTGIADDVRDRIFDSFFTTKAPGGGTGLGLDIAYRIVVTGHRGDLTVDSEPGRTTFTVSLPLS